MSEAVESPAVAPAAPAAAPSAPAASAEGAETPAQNTAAQAPATAPEGEKPESTGQDPEKQSSRRFERRLDKAYRKAAEAQARADFLEKQLNEQRAAMAPPADPGAPKLADFNDVEKYAEAKAKYESDKALKEHQAKQQSETHKQQQARLLEGWESKVARADSKYDDFDEVVGDIQPNAPWSMAVMEADNAEDVAYYLGKNLKEARRIAALPPLSQIREIGKIEAKLLAEPPKPKTPSKAPAPITPLKGAAPVASDTPSETDDMRDWMRKRQKQVHGKR